jgi:hypothetical protein
MDTVQYVQNDLSELFEIWNIVISAEILSYKIEKYLKRFIYVLITIFQILKSSDNPFLKYLTQYLYVLATLCE